MACIGYRGIVWNMREHLPEMVWFGVVFIAEGVRIGARGYEYWTLGVPE